MIYVYLLPTYVQAYCCRYFLLSRNIVTNICFCVLQLQTLKCWGSVLCLVYCNIQKFMVFFLMPLIFREEHFFNKKMVMVFLDFKNLCISTALNVPILVKCIHGCFYNSSISVSLCLTPFKQVFLQNYLYATFLVMVLWHLSQIYQV